jgi:hypothetical protein
MAEFHYNDKSHSATGQTLFFLNYGIHPWKGNLTAEMTNSSANSLIKELEEIWKEAKTTLEMNNDMMHSRGEQKKTKEDFKPSDSMWLEATNIHSNQSSQKLDNKRYGPFEVEEKVGDWAYHLKLPETWAIHNIFHLTLLTKTHTVDFDSQKKPMPPPPDIIEEEEEYEIKEICRHRRKERGTQFLVHWKGYGNEDDTWLPWSSLGNTEELLSKYLKQSTSL